MPQVFKLFKFFNSREAGGPDHPPPGAFKLFKLFKLFTLFNSPESPPILNYEPGPPPNIKSRARAPPPPPNTKLRARAYLITSPGLPPILNYEPRNLIV